MKNEDFKLPPLFDSPDIKSFFIALGGLKRWTEEEANKDSKKKMINHPRGFCNNPDCETCKNSISNE